MPHEANHADMVHAWLERCTQGLPPERIVEQFKIAFDSLWRRAHRTLGEVTLSAIGDRVLYVAAERYPQLTALSLDPDGVRCEALLGQADTLPLDELTAGVAYILTEFLTVVGTLTAEILTPPLHAELVSLARNGNVKGNS